jgi:hypothetical protein
MKTTRMFDRAWMEFSQPFCRETAGRLKISNYIIVFLCIIAFVLLFIGVFVATKSMLIISVVLLSVVVATFLYGFAFTDVDFCIRSARW